MSDIHSSIGGRMGSPEDRLRDPLYQAQLKQAREGAEQQEVLGNPASNLFHYATALFKLKKFIDEFAKSTKLQTGMLNRQKALEDLTDFKNIFEELGNVDRSHDPEFTHQLSMAWLHLYENCGALDENLVHSDPLSSQILGFVQEIAHFPPGEDHTLGYYLSEHAGQDWIPFPFMNILAELHEGFQNDPEKGQLAVWLHTLSSILGTYES